MDAWNYLLTHHEAIRNLLLSLAAIIGLPFLFWRTVIASTQTKAALSQAQTSEDNHISDMFTKAIEQLGTTTQSGEPHIELRLGGLYALEKIAQNNEGYHNQIMEVLCAYVRMHAVKPETLGTEEFNVRVASGELEVTEGALSSPRIDVQATMTIIGRRCIANDDESTPLNLQNVCLRSFDLSAANLENARLQGADLQDVNLKGADLRNCHLIDVNLNNSELTRANLSSAKLERANLSSAILFKSDLTEADLCEATLHHTRLDSACLRDALLHDASLTDATLNRADLSNASLHQATIKNSALRRADLSEAVLSEADLSNSNLQNTKLFGAELSGTNLSDVSLLGAHIENIYPQEMQDKLKDIQQQQHEMKKERRKTVFSNLNH